MYIIQFINANMYSLHVMGDQIQYMGLFRVAATDFIVLVSRKSKRIRIRRSLEKRLPAVRLQMDGVTYVH